MAGYYVPLPGAEIKNALVDFSPINNGLETLRDQKNTNRNALMQQQQIDMRKEEQTYQRGRDAQSDAHAKVKRGGDMANAISSMPDNDPAKAAAWSRYLKAYGDGNHSPEELDFRTGPKLAAAAAGKFFDPRDSQAKDLELQKSRAQIGLIGAQTAAANQRGDQGGLTKGAPAGYIWNDPRNPRGGVSPIPGVEKPVPGDVAGKVAMMNMARQGIEQTRGAFERDWGTADAAKYAAANVPLVGDLSAASGDIGIAQRNIRVGIEAALRTMTGAAAPEQEVKRYMQMFAPGVNDTKQSAKQKLDGLINFMNQAETLVLQGRGSVNLPALQGGPPPQSAPAAAGDAGGWGYGGIMK